MSISTPMNPAIDGLDERMTRVLFTIERTASVFSIVGCILISATFLASHRFRSPINRLIFYASWGNLLMTVATLMSVTPALLRDPKNAPLCRFQGFMIQTFLPADALWNLSIAINVFLTVFKKWSAAKLRRLETLYVLLNYGITFAVAFTYLFIDDESPDGSGRIYGPATLWCWVDRSWDGFRIWLCYAPVWACIVAIFTIYAAAWVRITGRKKQMASENSLRRPQVMSHFPITSKVSEVRVTTEIRRTSFHTPVQSPRAVAVVELTSKRLFNPFSLDPGNVQGYDTYSITIECAENVMEAKERTAATEANAAAWSYTRTALLYFVSLLITWVPSSMNRVYSLVYPDRVSFVFSILAALVLPLVGFWNSVIYFVTSWDALVAWGGDMMLKERTSALFGRCTSHADFAALTWVEYTDYKEEARGVGACSTEQVVEDSNDGEASGRHKAYAGLANSTF